ncbi:site-2 protease family protein [Dokdonella sp.]|uniref:site-2 protease family protein n=1 Tax=Dokdonella sp. TaxID=2291710 RepID=UPI002602E98E|nr:site-2 protease family protein [Dokdonella sp.]
MKLLLLLLNGAKLGKLLLTGGTMLLSVVAYAFVFGWRYAAGFVGLILVHEMGHYVAARRRGLDVGAPTFIPFVGAWIELKEQPRDAETEAYIGMAGPLAGSLGALACYYAARATGSDLLLALAYAGFFLNLFNLIPVSPFDGGRISAVISPRLWLLGAPLLVGLFFWRPSPLLILMAILAAPKVMEALRGFRSAEQQAYYLADAETRLSYAVLYLGLAGFLAVMCHELHAELPRAF